MLRVTKHTSVVEATHVALGRERPSLAYGAICAHCAHILAAVRRLDMLAAGLLLAWLHVLHFCASLTTLSTLISHLDFLYVEVSISNEFIIIIHCLN